MKELIDQAELVEAIEEAADEVSGSIREDYSGRGMYGKTCYGIVVDGSGTEVIEAAAALGVRGARTDNMGKGTIVYWPHVKGQAETEDAT